MDSKLYYYLRAGTTDVAACTVPALSSTNSSIVADTVRTPCQGAMNIAKAGTLTSSAIGRARSGWFNRS